MTLVINELRIFIPHLSIHKDMVNQGGTKQTSEWRIKRMRIWQLDCTIQSGDSRMNGNRRRHNTYKSM